MADEGWASLSGLVADLGLESTPDDTESIRSELKARLSQLHPDKTKGEFASEGDKERFLRLSKGIEFVDSLTNTESALIPANQISEIVKSVAETLGLASHNSVGALESEFRTNYRRRVGERYAAPKITSGAFAAICASIITLSDKLHSNPVLGPILQTRFSSYALLGLLLTSGEMFLVFWLRESREKNRAEYLTSDEGMREAFGSFCSRLLSKGTSAPGDPKGSLQFTALDYARFLGASRSSPPSLLHAFLGSGAKLAIRQAESLAQIHLGRLLARLVVRRVKKVGLDEWFEIRKRDARQIIHRD